MTSLRISEILLVSQVERRSRRVRFDDRRTIVIGKNDTGKSVLLKSIYHTFGAEPARVHPRWLKAEPTAVVSFSVDGADYRILRRDRHFALFSGNDDLIGRYDGVTNGIGPALAELTGFGLKLVDRQGQSITPPPAFQFLPFYVDQDASWTQNWSSFAQLAQFAKWKRNVVEYHLGIRDNRYYELLGERESARRAQQDLKGQLELLRSLRRESQRRLGAVEFSLDLEAFRGEIDDLIAECEALQRVEESLKQRLSEQSSRKLDLEQQIGAISSSLLELERDRQFATSNLSEEEVECPTCGAHYENAFAERFAIAQDESRLREFLVDLQNDLADVSEMIAATRGEFSNQRSEASKVRGVLRARQQGVTLESILEQRGRQEFHSALRARIDGLYRDIRDSDERLQRIQREVSEGEAEARKRRQDVGGAYERRMRRYADALNVDTLDEKTFASPLSKVRDTGSDVPRALMAYYYSVLHIMRDRAPAAFAPIVIDSPNQQAQDPENLQVFLEFIVREQPKDSQLVLGVEDAYEVDLGGTWVHLEEKLQLLQDESFAQDADEVNELLRISLMGL